MNVDRFCQLFILALLPLLYLPQQGLWLGLVVSLIAFVGGIANKKCSWIIWAVLLASCYGRVLYFVQQVDQVKSQRVEETIKIQQILKQGEYQAAIAVGQEGQRIYLNWQSETALQLDGVYRATLVRRPLSSRLKIGNFNRQQWYIAQGIEQLATVREARSLPNKASWRTQWLERVKQQTAELPTQGVILALAFGERAWLSQGDWQAFKQTSTAHLIAISGLHIALAFGLGVMMAKAFQWCCWRIERLQAVRFIPYFCHIIGLLLAIIYSYLAGFAIPTIRALFALFLLVFCQWLRRYWTPWQLWWRVVALLLLFEPLDLLSSSFWLSILAVASLLCWYQFFPLNHFLPEKCKKLPKTYRLLLGLVHLQCGLWLMFSPVQLYFFEGISPFAILANLLLVPLYSLLAVPLILFSLFTDNLFYTWQRVDELIQFSRLLTQPLANFWRPLSLSQQWQLLSGNLLILLMLLGWIRKWRIAWYFCVLPIMLYSLSRGSDVFGSSDKVQWLHFDVGQGLAMALVYSENGQSKAVMYDTGASWRGGSMAELEILPYLRREGIELVAIFVSHSDNDHAGGLPILRKAYPNARIILSQYAALADNSEPCIMGKQWQFGKISIKAIYPNALVEKAQNQQSCVLLVEIKPYQLLFTGDSGVAQEREFVQSLANIDFLQVGHHGSNTSSSHTLLAKTRPTFAMISTGRWNPWKLPTQQVEKRLAQYHITSLNTAKVGMIKVDFSPYHYQVSYARSPSKPWHQGYFGD